MKVAVLASGSKGNSVYVDMDGAKILIDAGISATRIKKALAAEGVEPSELDGVLITHEHTDHISGLVTLSKWYDLPIFSRAATFQNMRGVEKIPANRLNAIEGAFTLNGVRVEPFSISHDAADPVGYRLKGKSVCTLATDLGFVTDSVQAMLDGADALVIEANHDRDMLKNGSYAWPLKQRIMGNRGHLANPDTAWALARLKKKPQEVFLAHLSENNNEPNLARETVANILEQQGITLNLNLTAQNECVSKVIYS